MLTDLGLRVLAGGCCHLQNTTIQVSADHSTGFPALLALQMFKSLMHGQPSFYSTM